MGTYRWALTGAEPPDRAAADNARIAAAGRKRIVVPPSRGGSFGPTNRTSPVRRWSIGQHPLLVQRRAQTAVIVAPHTPRSALIVQDPLLRSDDGRRMSIDALITLIVLTAVLALLVTERVAPALAVL